MRILDGVHARMALAMDGGKLPRIHGDQVPGQEPADPGQARKKCHGTMGASAMEAHGDKLDDELGQEQAGQKRQPPGGRGHGHTQE